MLVILFVILYFLVFKKKKKKYEDKEKDIYLKEQLVTKISYIPVIIYRYQSVKKNKYDCRRK